jgi:predicted RNase H-like nuclease
MSQIANRFAEPKPDVVHVLGATYLSVVLLMCPRTMSIISPTSIQGGGRYWFSMDERGTVVGVDGCPAGWVCFQVDLQSRRTAVRVLANLGELISASPEPKLIAIDIPIGIPTSGARACDIAARKLLGKPRSNSVFPAPVRATFAARTYQEACALSLQAQGKSLSRQAFEIISKIREVDELITPELQMRIFEVHPEVSFWALNGGQSLKHKKLIKEGNEERLKLLLPHYPAIKSHMAEFRRTEVAEHDLLDAAVAAWTAECVATGAVPRQFDSRGLRMEIVF